MLNTENGLKWFLSLSIAAFVLAACQPAPQSNVVGYLLGKQLGTLENPNQAQPPGALEGRVLGPGAMPVSGATVVVAERTGTPHVARTDATGHYRIEGIPPDQVAPAAVAPGLAEAALQGLFGTPGLVTISAAQTTVAPDLTLAPYMPPPLPADLAAAVNLRQTAAYTATAPFPEGAAAQVKAFAFDYNGVTVDTLRLLLPLAAPAGVTYPLVLFVAPTAVDDWQDVTAAFAAQGYAVLALSPMAARGVDAEGQAQDVRVALALAQQDALGPGVGHNRPVAMGGSYSSAILARLLRFAGDELAGWVSVGGMSNAFTGAEAFYAGELEMPANFSLLVPAFGPPNLYPLIFLRYSPVFVAGELPPTLLIHTSADRVLPIDQAYQLETAARAAGVPVETYYYADVSHYLGIGENLTDAGREMFNKIVAFIERHSASEESQ